MNFSVPDPVFTSNSLKVFERLEELQKIREEQERSLVRPVNGFPTEFDAPFHTTTTNTINAANIAIANATTDVSVADVITVPVTDQSSRVSLKRERDLKVEVGAHSLTLTFRDEDDDTISLASSISESEELPAKRLRSTPKIIVLVVQSKPKLTHSN